MKKQCKKCKKYFITYDNRFNYCSNCRVKSENSNQKLYRDVNRQKQKQIIQERKDKFHKELKKYKIKRCLFKVLYQLYFVLILGLLIALLVK